jgi:hypothetical protein
MTLRVSYGITSRFTTKYLVETVDMIQHLYTCKATIAEKSPRGRSKLAKAIQREEYGKEMVLKYYLTSLTETELWTY